MVRFVPLLEISIVIVVPVLIIKLRSVEAVLPVYNSRPVPNTRLAAAFEDCPMFPATPPFSIVETLRTPALIVLTPV
jgi:hypothetical protein